MRKKFTKEKRLEIVKQSFDPGCLVADLTDRYGISAHAYQLASKVPGGTWG
jgi:transposase-like protein